MPGSLFREWKVALAFVAGIAMLAGAFVSDGGEHRYFERFKSRQPAAEVVAAPASQAAQPVRSAAHPISPGRFGSDAELEAAFSDPEEAEAKSTIETSGPGGSAASSAVSLAPSADESGAAEPPATTQP